MRGIARQGHRHGVGIVVPERAEEDVAACRGEAERNADGCLERVAVVGKELAQARVVDVDRELGVAPLADALCGQLERGDVGSGREIAVAEDVGDARVVCAVDAHGLAFLALDGGKVGGRGLTSGSDSETVASHHVSGPAAISVKVTGPSLRPLPVGSALTGLSRRMVTVLLPCLVMSTEMRDWPMDVATAISGACLPSISTLPRPDAGTVRRSLVPAG